MKKITAILIALVMCATCAFIIPDETYAAAKAKYTKVKTVTYEKMKKTISKQKKTIASQKKTIASQKKTITSQKSTISERNKTITSQKSTISARNTTIAEQKAQINDLNATIKDKKSTISWLWSTLEDFGFEYNYDTHKWEGEGPETAPLEWTDMMEDESIIPVMEEQTGLVIDHVEVIETWKTWACYYVEADGDLYVITMKKGIVDVCQILN